MSEFRKLQISNFYHAMNIYKDLPNFSLDLNYSNLIEGKVLAEHRFYIFNCEYVTKERWRACMSYQIPDLTKKCMIYRH